MTRLITSNEESRVLRYIDNSRAELVKFLQELIRGESITGREAVSQGPVSDILKGLGFSVDAWEPSRKDLGKYTRFLPENGDFSGRPNVVGILRGSGGKKKRQTLAFNGHIDVVPAGEESLWKYGPWEPTVKGGKVFGRGSCDMKAGLAAAIFAAKALVESEIKLENDLLLESVIGEENGGVGTLATILRGYVPDATIICEPTNLELLIAQCGCLMFRLHVFGKAAHGASRYLGVSALEEFQPVHDSLLKLEKKRKKSFKNSLFAQIPNPVTLSIGTVVAGNWDSTVPEELVAEGRYGVWPGESLEHAGKEFLDAVKIASSSSLWLRKHEPKVEWFGPQWESCELPRNHWLVKLVAQSYFEVEGETPRIGGEPGGTDMRLYTNVAGVPSLLFGPGDGSVAHFRDEFVKVNDLIKACRVYASAALNFGKTRKEN